MKVLFLCDHQLDPRLRKRVKIFLKHKYEVDVFAGNRAPWLSDGRPHNDLKNLKWGNLNYDLIYVSGAKIFFSHFPFFIYQKTFRRKICCEIPDLPLRKKNFFFNKLVLILFNISIRIIATKIVVTSPGFISKLPKKPFFIFENLPPQKTTHELLQIKKEKKLTTRISIIGVFRYIEQIEMIAQFVVNNVGYSLNFYGGPETVFREVHKKFNLDKKIKFHGNFSYSTEISNIYKNSDVVYAVYDSDQPNVRLALPNKLYECSISRTPILVAKNTLLSKTVKSLNIGLELPSSKNYYKEFKETIKNNLHLIKSKNFDYFNESLLYKTKTLDNEFIIFINEK
tara:strand:- start:4189 stop:5208 length:1020 start_codon:yes stop_codon:yes gene_type:complete